MAADWKSNAQFFFLSEQSTYGFEISYVLDHPRRLNSDEANLVLRILLIDEDLPMAPWLASKRFLLPVLWINFHALTRPVEA